ncbi:MAG: DUF4070 domain-containing protein, partial [Moorea sp. SIO2I5]|nr:DUF4070 domain-containing protein [Moorena sp. SIO2I5]
LFGIFRHNPAVWEHYLTLCAHNEHFLEYRQIVRDEIGRQLVETNPKLMDKELIEI